MRYSTIKSTYSSIKDTVIVYEATVLLCIHCNYEPVHSIPSAVTYKEADKMKNDKAYQKNSF